MFLALPSLLEITHFRASKSITPAIKTDRGIHKYGWLNKKPRSRVGNEISIAELIFII